jgi:hypothetical protein
MELLSHVILKHCNGKEVGDFGYDADDRRYENNVKAVKIMNPGEA